MQHRWTMTHEDWARRVDALIVERAPALLYALRGRTSQTEHERVPVAAEHFKAPHWQSTRGFVIVYEQPNDSRGIASQGRASYMPVSLDPVRPGDRIVARNRTRYYDRDEAGARRAASEIAGFLTDGTLPPADAAT